MNLHFYKQEDYDDLSYGQRTSVLYLKIFSLMYQSINLIQKIAV